MVLRNIPVAELNLQPFTTFDPDGLILISGSSPLQANPMTISWGLFGIMWGKPIAMVMVRPTRHTRGFITRHNDFTLNWLPKELSAAVRICGSTSGRQGNKFDRAKLTPVASSIVAAPGLQESVLTLECRIAYRGELQSAQFVDKSLLNAYTENDYHGLFYGEILLARGIEQFKRGPSSA